MKKRMIVILIGLLIISISGCAAQQTATKGIPKSFFDRTITYTVDHEAREHMNKLERLLSIIYNQDPPLPDDIVVSLYKETDSFGERDRYITLQEAKSFYEEYVMRFEDSLKPVKSSRIKSGEIEGNE